LHHDSFFNILEKVVVSFWKFNPRRKDH